MGIDHYDDLEAHRSSTEEMLRFIYFDSTYGYYGYDDSEDLDIE